jgi:hypothetical protein
MKRLALVAVALAGCFNPTYHNPACGPGGECPNGLSCIDGICGGVVAHDDARLDDMVEPDAMDDAPMADAAPICVGSGAWQLCFTGAAPTNAVTLTGTINTDTSPLCASNVTWTSSSQPLACVIAGNGISVGNSTTVSAVGTRALVLVSTSTITLGTGSSIDVASHRAAGTTGAGSPSALCPAFPTKPVDAALGAGGGAGGSFISAGGNGGAGGHGAAGGTAPAGTSAPAVLRAGCNGQTGGLAAAGSAGVQGRGGGAIYLAASTSITFGGSAINASGSSGTAGDAMAGGGGGGAGGMIVLWAPTITANSASRLVANGAGGGGGGGGSKGQDGSDPSILQLTTPAQGGPGGGGNTCGGNAQGGDGAAGATVATTGTNGNVGADCGGGGGGGGGGYVRSNVSITNVVTSPALSIVP